MFPVIEVFEESDLTRQEFADQNDIPLPVLDYWRRQHRDSKELGEGFVLVDTAEGVPISAPSTPHVEIIFRDGTTVRYVGEVDPSFILRIIERAA